MTDRPTPTEGQMPGPDPEKIALPDAESEAVRNLVGIMTDAVSDEVLDLVDKAYFDAGFTIDWSDDGNVEKYGLPMENRIYTLLGELIAGMTDND